METTGEVKPPRRRRTVLTIGMIVVGLMVAAFMGLRFGGSGAGARALRGGLNAALPAAHFRPEKPMDKLGVYEQAKRDSARVLERQQQDVFGRFSFGAAGAADSSAGRMLAQIEELKRIARPAGVGGGGPASGRERGVAATPGLGPFRAPAPEGPAREQLEGVLRRMQRGDTGEGDPRLDRLSGMLDKIIRIQKGPDSDKVGGRGTVGVSAMPLEQPRVESAVKDMGGGGLGDAGGFYGIDGEDTGDTVDAGNSFPAMIPETQVLVVGATVGLRLMREARIGGVLVPCNQLLYGKAALAGDRLTVTINSIRVGQGVYPVALQVYDLDGLAGIHVPGAITRDVLKQSAAEGVNGIGVVGAEGSLGASAAEAGVTVARSLFSRKVELVRVTVPSGYRVLLRNQKSDNH